MHVVVVGVWVLRRDTSSVLCARYTVCAHVRVCGSGQPMWTRNNVRAC